MFNEKAPSFWPSGIIKGMSVLSARATARAHFLPVAKLLPRMAAQLINSGFFVLIIFLQ